MCAILQLQSWTKRKNTSRWTYEDSHIISINQVWFQSDFNFSNEAIFTFSVYLTTWPQMTFDLGIWPFTTWTYEGSHIISIHQVRFQSNFQLFKWGHFHIFSLTVWPNDLRWPLTLMWPLTSSTNEGSHVASKFWILNFKFLSQPRALTPNWKTITIPNHQLWRKTYYQNIFKTIATQQKETFI